MTTALVLTTATASTAQEYSQIRGEVEDKLVQMNIIADVSALNDDRLSEIFQLASSGDSGDRGQIQAALSKMMGPMATMEVSNSQLRTSVRKSLTEMGNATASQIQETFATMQPDSADAQTETVLVINVPEGQLRNSVGNRLQTMSIEVDVEGLPQDQLSQLHLLTSSSDDNVRAQVESIVN